MKDIRDYDYIQTLIQNYKGNNLQLTMEDNFIIVSFMGSKHGNEVEVTIAAPYTLELYAALNILLKHVNHGY